MTTTYFLNNIMGNVFTTKTDPTLPINYYIGLSTSAPSLDGSGVSEPASSAGYARVRLSNLSEPINGVITNQSAVSFEESISDWGLITHFVIYDSLTGGNLLMYDALSASRSVEAATVVTIKENSLQLTLANPT